jgi:hypothetical protein
VCGTGTAEKATVREIGRDMMAMLARRFPVSCASDEYYFFPQATITPADWTLWDRYDTDTVADTVQQLKAFSSVLRKTSHRGSASAPPDREERIDCELLLRTAATLADQLETVRSWQTQPTLVLSMACIGLAQALEEEDPDAVRQRAGTLGAFLEGGRRHLQGVPELYRELGLEMAVDTRKYFQLLLPRLPAVKNALEALARFEDTLRHLSCRTGFTLPADVFEIIVRDHMDTGLTVGQMVVELDDEVAVARADIARILAADFSGRPLEEAIGTISLPKAGPGGLLKLYGDEVQRLCRHCLSHGLVSEQLAARCPVQVRPVPDYLSATRAASSYSIRPGHPPTGGIFYIHGAGQPGEEKQSYQREYRILSAHETWPGHHLLDIRRWGHRRPVRRVVEHPTFYEGWACFAEEVMHRTGYFHTPRDRLLMARRRLWRAVRGRVDLGLQTGQMALGTAAAVLEETGVPPARARSVVRKYPLNPGYQLCYTAGLRSFERLYRRYGRQDPARFATVVLSGGEVGFRQLERSFCRLQR